MYKILIVEDDKIIARAMGKYLETWHYDVRIAEQFKEIMKEFQTFHPDMVLLDISLPYRNGYHWCEQIRKISSVPIIFISSASDNMNIVMAIGSGGDDFIAKPFDLTILAAKIQALLRRAYDFSGQLDLLEYQGLRFNMSDATIMYDGRETELTKNEVRILKMLMTHPGKIIDRETMMNELWQTDAYIDDNTLTVNVNRLRRKLESIGISGWIKTKKGMGYMI